MVGEMVAMGPRNLSDEPMGAQEGQFSGDRGGVAALHARRLGIVSRRGE